MDTKKPDSITGKPRESTLILASESDNMGEKSKRVQPKTASASIKAGLILAVLQTDFSDLQSKGLKVVILAKNKHLYFSVEYPGHELGFDTGNITLDGKKVVDL